MNDKINWCLTNSNGIKLNEPSKNISEAYLIKAKESLESIHLNKYNEWKIATAYYSMYFSLYAILVLIGIKCEIHSCTIEFAKEFLYEYLKIENIEFIEKTLKARINTQYYTDRKIQDIEMNLIIKKTPEIYVLCKEISEKLTEIEITKIRKKLET